MRVGYLPPIQNPEAGVLSGGNGNSRPMPAAPAFTLNSTPCLYHHGQAMATTSWRATECMYCDLTLNKTTWIFILGGTRACRSERLSVFLGTRQDHLVCLYSA